MDDNALRESLAAAFERGGAHVTAEKALANVAPGLRNVRPAKGIHSVWEEAEHLRLTLEVTLHALTRASGAWTGPRASWPSVEETFSAASWSVTLLQLFTGIKELAAIAKDPRVDLASPAPHGDGATYLRVLLQAAAHTSYHIGQIVMARKILGDWKE